MSPPTTQIIPTTIATYESARIIERPDGFFWQEKTSGREYGPFESLLEAIADMEYIEEPSLESDQSLEDAETEIGMSSWIDPDTGEPAEAGCPHIEEH